MWRFVLIGASFVIALGDQQVTQLRGYSGGEVAFHCPVDKNGNCTMISLQKGVEVVNMFPETKTVSKWPNSRLESNTVYVSELNISHSGDYTCHVDCHHVDLNEALFKLTVTANYTRPSLDLINCTDKRDQCWVRCSSHGGYPEVKPQWKDPPPANISSPNTTPNAHDAQLFDISSEAAFNCSSGGSKNVSCSVDGVTSHLTICEPGSNSTPDSNIEDTNVKKIIGIVIGVLFGIILALAIGFVIFKKFRKRSYHVV